MDDEDFERLNQFKWYAHAGHNTFYAVRTITIPGKQMIRMHREIMSALPGVEIDHRNGDGLDNQKDNLRFASGQQNRRNTRKRTGTSSPYKGVTWDNRKERWMAQIGTGDGCEKFLGYFQDEIEAACAYDAAARKYFGEFARLNFSETETVAN